MKVWLRQTLDFNLELAALFVEPDVTLFRVKTTLTVVESLGRGVRRVLGLELKTRGQHLLHEKARCDCFQRVIDRFRYCLLRGIWLGDQVRETGARFAFGIACRATNDLYNLGKA